MTRDEALNMIVASIAMEELALSHILNAEGEKLQYILGTLLGTSPSTRPQDVLAVNKSVTTLVEAVTQNQMLLKNKLDHVLEFFPLPAPESGLSQTPTVPPSLIQIPTPKPPPAPRPDPPHIRVSIRRAFHRPIPIKKAPSSWWAGGRECNGILTAA